jgi:hypothetical protein
MDVVISKEIAEGTTFDKILSHYRNAGSKHPIKNIVLIKVDRILPLISPAYFTSLSEEDIRNWWIQYWDQINKPK